MSDEPGPIRDDLTPAARAKKAQGVSGAQFAGIGIQFAASILVFLFAGQWLDRRLGTNPTLTVLMVFVGAGASFYSMYRKLMTAQREEEAARAHERDPNQKTPAAPSP